MSGVMKPTSPLPLLGDVDKKPTGWPEQIWFSYRDVPAGACKNEDEARELVKDSIALALVPEEYAVYPSDAVRTQARLRRNNALQIASFASAPTVSKLSPATGKVLYQLFNQAEIAYETEARRNGQVDEEAEALHKALVAFRTSIFTAGDVSRKEHICEGIVPLVDFLSAMDVSKLESIATKLAKQPEERERARAVRLQKKKASSRLVKEEDMVESPEKLVRKSLREMTKKKPAKREAVELTDESLADSDMLDDLFAQLDAQERTLPIKKQKACSSEY